MTAAFDAGWNAYGAYASIADSGTSARPRTNPTTEVLVTTQDGREWQIAADSWEVDAEGLLWLSRGDLRVAGFNRATWLSFCVNRESSADA